MHVGLTVRLMVVPIVVLTVAQTVPLIVFGLWLNHRLKSYSPN